MSRRSPPWEVMFIRSLEVVQPARDDLLVLALLVRVPGAQKAQQRQPRRRRARRVRARVAAVARAARMRFEVEPPAAVVELVLGQPLEPELDRRLALARAAAGQRQRQPILERPPLEPAAARGQRIGQRRKLRSKAPRRLVPGRRQRIDRRRLPALRDRRPPSPARSAHSPPSPTAAPAAKYLPAPQPAPATARRSARESHRTQSPCLRGPSHRPTP